jgi:hypothetical protein
MWVVILDGLDVVVHKDRLDWLTLYIHCLLVAGSAIAQGGIYIEYILYILWTSVWFV